jgi:hypothetical protein
VPIVAQKLQFANSVICNAARAAPLAAPAGAFKDFAVHKNSGRIEAASLRGPDKC